MTPIIQRAASANGAGRRTIEPAQDDYELVSALRQGTWQLLDEYSHRGSGKSRASVIVGLQDVANRLGAVERLLRQ